MQSTQNVDQICDVKTIGACQFTKSSYRKVSQANEEERSKKLDVTVGKIYLSLAVNGT